MDIRLPIRVNLPDNWIDLVIERIKQDGTVQVVRHGSWTVTSMYIKCSECGEAFMLIPQNYCPYCGAKMDLEEQWANLQKK